jgi:hypothetical protein
MCPHPVQAGEVARILFRLGRFCVRFGTGCVFSRVQWRQLRIGVPAAQFSVSGDRLVPRQFRGGVPSLPGVCDLGQGLAVGADF